MRLPRVSDLPSTRIQVGISGTKDAYSSNFDAAFGARLCGLCMKFGACPRRYEPPEAGDRACVGSYEPNEAAGARTFGFDLADATGDRACVGAYGPGVASGVLACDRGPANVPEARPGALVGLPGSGMPPDGSTTGEGH